MENTMAYTYGNVETLYDVLRVVDQNDLSPARRRDLKSAVKRVCEMAGVASAGIRVEMSTLKVILGKIRPALHGVSPKTWANLLSLLRAALQLAGVIDPMVAGLALRHPAWAPLLRAITGDKRVAYGLAAFANRCAALDISPNDVADPLLHDFHTWLEVRTLCPKPRDVVRRIPHLWNKASKEIEAWPKIKLTTLCFKNPRKHLAWEELNEDFRRDVERYRELRAHPDVFDERANAPQRPLAASTLQAQSEHARLSASVLIESGVPVEEIRSLADLVYPERFKIVLRHYHQRANGQPNAFATCLAQTLVQVAQYFVGVSADELAQLKRIAAKLPSIPFDLTPKNKALMRQFESERLRAKLLFLPEVLIAEVTNHLEKGRLRFVEAQVAIAIDVQLAIALRPQNLSSLNWQRHLGEPDGPRGRLLLHIPAAEMKSRRDDFVAEVPDHVARRLRWYRRHILPRLKGNPNGDLFITRNGCRKDQRTLTIQIIKIIERRLGIHMTTHQFRHLAGNSYLEENPQDSETARLMLGHAWAKTTRIYVGSPSRRASRAYNTFLFEQRERLKLKRKRQLNGKRKKGSA
jgi:integrase